MLEDKAFDIFFVLKNGTTKNISKLRIALCAVACGITLPEQ